MIEERLEQDNYSNIIMENDASRNLTNASEWLWKLISPIILCFGLVGNVLTVCVIKRLGVSKQPTLVFICFLAVDNAVVLITGLPRYWIYYSFNYDLRTSSNAGCKLYYFLIYTTMQYSSWILVGVSLERIVATYFPFKYRRVFTSTKVVIGLILTLFLLILVNGHFWFTNGINDYTEGDCGSLSPEFVYFDEYIFVYIDFVVLSVVPFIIMLMCTIFLVKILREIQRNRATMMRNTSLKRTQKVSVRMTKMLLFCVFYFLVATAPVSVYFIVDSYLLPGYTASGNDEAIARMDIVRSVTYLLQYSNYSVNFYLYTAMNDIFSTEMMAILRCKPSLRQTRIDNSRCMSSNVTRNHGVSQAGPEIKGLLYEDSSL